jgi:tetratricopeptide (TPR) repeat protein
MLADITWALGDLDAALATAVEAIARSRSSPLARRSNFGTALINLAGVRTERGELDEALAAAREGLPLLQEAGYAWNVLDHPARIEGYADSIHTAKESTRQPNEARARERLRALLHEMLAPDELQRLLAEGAKFSEDDACRVSLEE